MKREDLSPDDQERLKGFLAAGGRLDDPSKREHWQLLAAKGENGCPISGSCRGNGCPYGGQGVPCSCRHPDIARLALATIDALCATPVSTALIGEKPVTAFEEGKWYRWVGPKKRPTGLSEGWAEDMDGVLDGKPHLCVATDGLLCAAFDVTGSSRQDWSWRSTMQFFREVPAPTQSARGVSKTAVIQAIQARDALLQFGHTRIAVGVDSPWSSRCSPPVSVRVALRRKLLGL